MQAAEQSGHPIERSSAPVEKEERLRGLMRQSGRVLVAYSGGVDSAYLAYIASAELGRDALSVLGISPSVSADQRKQAVEMAGTFGFNFRTVETEEFADPNYVSNPNNRCFFCKSELFEKLTSIARSENFNAVFDGTNADDIGGHRPGRAAADEKGVISPLVEVGLTKTEIRELSQMHGLPTWDKPASPCLSSRVAYGVPVTIERLGKVEKGEAIIRDMGFREFRLRVHGDIARIEISQAELGRALDRELLSTISASIKELGFKFVTLDMDGYRSGAMN
jgi:uncharacterized protein